MWRHSVSFFLVSELRALEVLPHLRIVSKILMWEKSPEAADHNIIVYVALPKTDEKSVFKPQSLNHALSGAHFLESWAYFKRCDSDAATEICTSDPVAAMRSRAWAYFM
ncbi:hypothetical protein Y032_0023g806 [Ancylostoma ceylanicum]|uniref:Uncharacterized protein n=1 Tax=Ancylostoma ceylanicum TaxID=53326 RepID=A0A016UZT1_9BILA|nr:hypothetical protein Y032_0023g806 [Ancylostoma ceylanicum]